MLPFEVLLDFSRLSPFLRPHLGHLLPRPTRAASQKSHQKRPSRALRLAFLF
jgi:hypothetical protein